MTVPTYINLKKSVISSIRQSKIYRWQGDISGAKSFLEFLVGTAINQYVKQDSSIGIFSKH